MQNISLTQGINDSIKIHTHKVNVPHTHTYSIVDSIICGAFSRGMYAWRESREKKLKKPSAIFKLRLLVRSFHAQAKTELFFIICIWVDDVSIFRMSTLKNENSPNWSMFDGFVFRFILHFVLSTEDNETEIKMQRWKCFSYGQHVHRQAFRFNFFSATLCFLLPLFVSVVAAEMLPLPIE